MALIIGNNRSNTLIGTGSADIISGRGGNDRIIGNGGDDLIQGGDGNDRIDGGRGNDVIDGGSGSDVIDGGRGNDLILGGDGSDVIDGGSGNDQILAGSGNDIVDGGSGDDSIDGGSGNDVIGGGSGNDAIDGGSGNDFVDGGSGNDSIDGGTGNDVMVGGSGNDFLDGGSGNDFLSGGSGDDALFGGTGSDLLTGGSGNDRFIFRAASESPASGGWDRITDFSQGRDKIDLSDILGPANLAWGDRTATVNGVWYQNLGFRTFVFVDDNGDGRPDLTIELTNTFGLRLTPNDFIGVGDTPAANNAPVITSHGGGDSASVIVAEDTMGVNTVTATDPDAGDTQTFSIVGGADAAKFSINSATGVLAFISAPNFEAPTDADGNNIYEVTVRVTDRGGLSDTQAIAVTVIDQNDVAPTITSGATGSEAENTATSSVVYDANATDSDTVGTVAFSLTGTDAGRFSINSATGEVTFLASPDFEAPTDADANNLYEVVVHANDGVHDTTRAVTIAVTNVNDAPVTTAVTLAAVDEDSGARLITQAELLANATDVDNTVLTATGLAISSGNGTLVDNLDGTWSYTPALNDDASVAFSYSVTDGSLSVPGSATLEITAVNDAPVTTAVTLAAVDEDSGARLITQAELLANATDVDNTVLTATGLAISSGNGTLVDNLDGTWSYTPALNDDASVAFSYSVTDGSLSVPGSATLEITAVNDAPVTTAVTLAAVDEDSGARLITQAELLANATDVDNTVLTATGLAISSGNGTLVDNLDGTWSYTPALNDDASVAFSYSVTDGSLSVPGSATLEITAVNDAPVTTAVTLAAVDEDSGARLITQAELLANATDVDNTVLTATGLAISSGNGTLVDNLDGTWSYTPALNDDASVAFSYSVTDGSLSVPGSATLEITAVNDAPVTTAVTLAAVDEDSGARLITQAELLANATDVDNTVLTATGLAISSGNGTLVDNLDGTWSYTPALNDDASVAFSYSVTDGSLSVPGSATLEITAVNDAPVTTAVTLAAVDEDSGARLITQAELLANATDVDNTVLTATGLAISSGNGTLVDNLDGTWSYTPALNDDASVAFSYSVTDGSLSVPGSATLEITAVNDAPVTTAVTLAAVDEDSGARLITQAELLANATDVDNTVLTATGLAISSGNGTLVDNLDGTWSYTPALNDDASVAFSYSVTDGSLSVPGSATLEITAVNDAPVTTAVTLAAVDEDSGARLITQAELLANATDVDNTVLTATGLAISSGNGTLVDNLDGTWSYTPALNDDASVAFSYSVTDGSLSVPGSATLEITAVNDAPVTTAVTLAAVDEDSGARLITQAELLANATDVDNTVLTATGLAISSGNGTLVDNLDGTWSYTPALNDDASVAFSYSVTDGSLSVPGSATLEITAVNDAPVTTAVTLAAVDEDSGARLITQAELLANATDVDNTVLTATGLAISSGNGTLVDNLDGTWSYTPALNDDASVAFSYSVTDGSLSVPGSATLEITAVNDAPVTTAVTLAAVDEDSGARLITQAELLANATDVDNTVLTATGLAISSGNGTLVDNLDGTWSYTPALNDDASVAFSYSVTDGSLSVPGSATLEITAVNDAPVTTAVTLAAVDEDSGARLITQAELLANATDVDNTVLTATGLAISSGNGTLVDNLDGTWSYTPALNDDASVAFSYSVTDGSLSVPGSATLEITAVNDAPVTTAVTLAAVDEDSGARLITQAELLANATDVDNTVLTATGLAISSGNGTLVDNLDGTWSYTPALNDDASVAFSYSVTDGSLSVPGSATLEITAVNDAPVTTAVTLAAVDEDSGARLITQAELLANATDVDNTVLTATGLAISSGNGTLVDNLDGTWSYTPALNDDASVAFSYSVTDGSLSVPGSATLEITAVNDAPVTTAVTLAAVDEDSGARLITQAELLANATDVDNTVLTATGLAISSGNGTLVDNLDGTWSYTPALNDDASVAFSYSVTDGSLSVPGSATLEITAVNDAPVITVGDSDGTTDSVAATLTETNAGLTASGTLSVTDADLGDTVTPSDTVTPTVELVVLSASGPDGGLTSSDVLNMHWLTVTPASIAAEPGDSQNLSWSFNSGLQAFDFLAAGDWLKLDYTVMADDGHGGTDTQTVTITINGTDEAPGNHTVTANNDFVITNLDIIGDGLLIPASALLANDTDSQGDPLHIGTVTSPAGIESGDVIYVADSTSGSFDYTASDGSVGSAPATVNVYVTPAMDVDGNLLPLLGEEFTQLGEASVRKDILIAGDDGYFLEGYGGDDFLFAGYEIDPQQPDNPGTGVLFGDAGNDTLIGGDGDDFLFGGNEIDPVEHPENPGADILFGDAGNDTLVGGDGNDDLEGGAGADIFQYNAIADAGTAGDTIRDFNTLDGDKLDLQNLLVGYTFDTAVNGGYLIIDEDSLAGAIVVQVDIDGSGGPDSAITLATLNGVTAIGAGDFIL